MKKPVLFLLLGVLLPTILFSQGMRYGIIGGMNVANWAKDVDKMAQTLEAGYNEVDGFSGFSVTNKPRYGLNFGLFVEFPKTKSLYFKNELMYVQKGVNFIANGSISDYYGNHTQVKIQTIMQLDYVDYNFLVKYYLNDNQVRFYVSAGPGAGLLVNSKIKAIAEGDGDSNTDTKDVKDLQKKIDVSLNVLAGLEFNENFSVDCHYLQGLLQVSNDGSSEKIVNRGIMLNFNVNF